MPGDAPNEPVRGIVKPPKALAHPIPNENGASFLSVDMSAGKAEWSSVDFRKKDNKADGIYTDGLTYCCAVALIQYDKTGENRKPVQVWLAHINGGLIKDSLPDLPDKLQEAIKDKRVKAVIKYGISESMDEKDRIKAAGEVLGSLYQIPPDQINLYDSKNNNTSLAIHRSGVIGVATSDFPVCNTGRKKEEKMLTVTHNVKAINQTNYDREYAYFDAFSKNAPTGKQTEYREILNKITQVPDPDKTATTKALYLTRNFLANEQNNESTKKYSSEMNALGPGWGKIILLAIKSCFSKESADQMEKCLNMKKQLAEIVTTANDNTAKKNDNSLNAEKEPPRQQMMP